MNIKFKVSIKGAPAAKLICQESFLDPAYIWLTKRQKSQKNVFYDFKGKKLTGEVLETTKLPAYVSLGEGNLTGVR